MAGEVFRRGGMAEWSMAVVLKNGSAACQIREIPSKVRTSRQIGRVDRIPSRGVLTVPWCPDRYTASDTDTLNQVAVIDSQQAFGKHCGVFRYSPDQRSHPSAIAPDSAPISLCPQHFAHQRANH